MRQRLTLRATGARRSGGDNNRVSCSAEDALAGQLRDLVRRKSGFAQHLETMLANLRRGTPGPLPPPLASMDGYWLPTERQMVEHSLAYAVVGSPETVQRGLQAFIEGTGIDELMITAQIYDHLSRLRSFEIAAAARDALGEDRALTLARRR